MTELPTPSGHIFDLDTAEYSEPAYTADQLRDYGRAEYLRGLEDAAKVCENMERKGAWITKLEAAAHIRALKEQPNA